MRARCPVAGPAAGHTGLQAGQVTSLHLDSAETTETGATEFRFTVGRHLAFRSGHAALLVLPGGGVKPFSIASAQISPTVSIATEVHPGSRFKQAS